MNEWTAGEPTLADVQAEFPDWVSWRGNSGMYYARHKSTSEDRDTTLTCDAKGEDPMDLRDMIIKWIRTHEDGDKSAG
jgi:hypothetical protein